MQDYSVAFYLFSFPLSLPIYNSYVAVRWIFFKHDWFLSHFLLKNLTDLLLLRVIWIFLSRFQGLPQFYSAWSILEIG